MDTFPLQLVDVPGRQTNDLTLRTRSNLRRDDRIGIFSRMAGPIA